MGERRVAQLEQCPAVCCWNRAAARRRTGAPAGAGVKVECRGCPGGEPVGQEHRPEGVKVSAGLDLVAPILASIIGLKGKGGMLGV